MRVMRRGIANHLRNLGLDRKADFFQELAARPLDGFNEPAALPELNEPPGFGKIRRCVQS